MGMTDRELLELAARAYGYEPQDYIESKNALVVFNPATGTGDNLWAPLADDTDAFRLLAASPYLDTQWWVTEAWQASNTEEGRRAYLRRRIVTAVASIFKIGEQNG